jgi:hypothetical protein
MAIASAAVRSSNTTTAQSPCELIASANNAYKLMETGISIAAATTSVYLWGAPAAIGLTPTTPAACVFEDGGNTSTPATTTALAWATSPTPPTVSQRRVSLPATIGAGVVWTFPRGYAVLKAKTLTYSNSGTTSAADIWWVIDE